MKLVRLYENRQSAKTALKGLSRAFDNNYWAKVYVQSQTIFIEADVPDERVAEGIFISGEPMTDDDLPAITECHEFYRGEGLRRFQPYHGRRR